MGQNILITGGAGYIGGSIVADFAARKSGPLEATTISTAVRSKEQVQALSNLGVNVIQIDLSDEKAVKEAVSNNEIDIVVHTASSMDGRLASHLIKALGQRRKVNGKEAYFVHSSVTTLYSVEAGWPAGEVKDTDPILQNEKQNRSFLGAHHVLQTNILVAELAKAEGVTSFNVVVPFIYGRGTGEWRKLSVAIPAYIRISIAHKVVYKFDVEGSPPAAHISDLVALYALLVEQILQKRSIPSGEQGYYFAMAHRSPWWAVMDRIAECLHMRTLVNEAHPRVWPSDEMAAEYTGFPIQYIRAIGTANGDIVPINAYRLGWQPNWNKEKYLESIDDEIQAVLDLDTVKTSLFKSYLQQEDS